MSTICKATLVDVKNDYKVRVNNYINKLYNKSFNEITDPKNPLTTVNGTKFLNVKRTPGSETGFSIEVNQQGMDKLILKETYRVMKKDGEDENILPPLPPASMLPGTPLKTQDDFNFAETLAHRKNLKDSVDKKIQLLRNEELREGTSRQQLEQIATLKDLSVNLFKEIQFLEKNDGDIGAFIDNLAIDIENMDTLLKNPTVENLEFVRKYKEMIDLFVKKGKGGFLNMAFTNIKETKPDIYTKIVAAQQRIGEVDKLFEDKIQTKITEKIAYHLKQKEENKGADEAFIQEEAEKLYDEQFAEQEDVNYVLKFYTRMDEQEAEGNVITSVIKKAYDDAIRNNGKKGVEDKLLAKEKAISDRLLELGHSIGGFFNKKALWDVFKTDNKGENRLINVFTVKWQKFKKQNEDRQRIISKMFYNFSAENSDAQVNTIDAHYESLNKEVDFIDVRKLPEIIENSNFTEFSGNFAEEKEAKEYKQSLIERIGQREYDKIVKEAKDNINSFMIEKDVKLNQLMDEYKVSDVKDLQKAIYEADAENVWNFYLQNFYTKSPFVFAENHFDEAFGNKVAKVFFIDNKQYVNREARANLDYSTFIPKDKYKDKRFEETIKNDATLLEAWELMDELVEYSNKNGTNYNSDTDLLTDLGHEKKDTHLLMDVLGLFSPNVLKNLKRISNRLAKTVSGQEFKKETGDDRSITGARVTTESKIRNQYKKLLTIDNRKEKDLTDEEIQIYRERALELVNAEANNENLLHNIVTSSQMTGAFKARKEVETFVKFLANQVKGIQSRGGFSEMIEYFINKNLYGISNRGKSVDGKLRNRFGKKVKYYPREHEQIRKEIKAGIKKLKAEIADNPNMPDRAEVEKNIEELEAMKEDGVLYVNGRDVSEAVLFKIKAFTAFAINGSAQVTNMAIASANAYEVDGRKGFWKSGNYTKAMSFARKYKNVGLITSKKMAEQRKIMDLFLKSANLVQNSANEIYKEQTSRYGSAIRQVVKNPTNFVGEVEKTIQKPQLLALLSDIDITDKDGNTVKVFNPNKGGSFPAFEIKDGVLVLKPEFAEVPANVDTFIKFSNQEAANLFGESGRLPKAIAFINGDYRDSTSYLAEKYLVTAMTLMFKRWAIATIYKKAGIYKRLAENDQNTASIGYQLLKAGIFATAVGSAGIVAGVSMPMVLGVAIGGYAVKHRETFIATLQEDTKKMEGIYKDTKQVELALTAEKFMKGSLTAASMILSTGAQALLNMPSRFIGRDVIDSAKLKSMIYVDTKNITAKSEAEIREDLYFLQTSTALVLRNMVYGVMLHAVYSLLDPGFDDDEEKEKYKEAVKEEKGVLFAEEDERTKLQTIKEYPALATYYALNNMLASFAEDMSLTENVGGLQRMGQAGSMEDVWNIGEAFVKGDEYKVGERKGKSKALYLAKKYVVPSSINMLGFGNKMERDYNTEGLVDTSLKSDFELLQKIQKDFKNEAQILHKEELKKEIEYEMEETDAEKKKWLKNQLSAFARREYPSFKLEDFNKDGTLSPEGESKIENYKDKLPEDMLRRLFKEE